jgi:hypothetical protein
MDLVPISRLWLGTVSPVSSGAPGPHGEAGAGYPEFRMSEGGRGAG